MNRIDKKFEELKRTGKKALIVYIAAGDPNITITKRLVMEFENRGVDIVELGVPFSDPLADGPTIQAASQRALKHNICLKDIFRAVRSLRKTVRIPFVLMTYYNPVLQYGVKKFISDAKDSGVDGVIVPDLPHEESDELLSYAKKEDFSLVQFAAPTSTDDRLKAVSRKAGGFIYYVSITGVTGARSKLEHDVKENVRRIKRFTRKPVCVGFGVSTPEQARYISRVADGVIVGSAVIRVIEKYIGKRGLIKEVGKFVHSLAKGVKGQN